MRRALLAAQHAWQQVREHARADDQVQRQQQVDRAPVRGDRQAEGQREHRQQRKRILAAAHQHDERGDHERRADRRAHDTPGLSDVAGTAGGRSGELMAPPA